MRRKSGKSDTSEFISTRWMTKLRFEDAAPLLPPGWQAELAGHVVETAAGMGGAPVFRVLDPTGGCRYLKLASGPEVEPLRQEIARTEWLSSRHIRVPEILMKVRTDKVAAVLMTAVPGRHLAPEHLAPEHLAPEHLAHGHLAHGDLPAMVRAIGRGLARLHALPAADCPFDEMPRSRLQRAREAIDRNLIDSGEFDDHNT